MHKSITALAYPPECNTLLALREYDSSFELPECAPHVEVVRERTLEAAWRLLDKRPLILNFASARNPGGGYLFDVQGQEEDLCRQLHLAERLTSAEAAPFYACHQQEGPLNTDWALYLPTVKEKNGTRRVDVVSCAAPHAKQAALYGVKNDTLRTVLQRRISRVLDVAVHHGHQCLVLGAWGCGHFGGDPWMTAECFAEVLRNSRYASFSHITFAIYSTSLDDPYLAFRKRFV